MDNQLFRKKSLDRLSSPEQLNDYFKVTSPSVWVVLLAVILLLAGLIIWSNYTSVVSYVPGTGKAEQGVMTITMDDNDTTRQVEAGMMVSVGDLKVPVSSVGTGEDGHIVAVCNAAVPDGAYDVKISYSSMRIIRLLLN